MTTEFINSRAVPKHVFAGSIVYFEPHPWILFKILSILLTQEDIEMELEDISQEGETVYRVLQYVEWNIIKPHIGYDDQKDNDEDEQGSSSDDDDEYKSLDHIV